MDPRMTTSGAVNLAHAGIYSVWTGEDLGAPLTNSPQSSIRSQSTLVNDNVDSRTPNSNVGTTPREPIKQTSAAWTSLRNTQHQLPTRATITPTPAPPIKSDMAVPDQAFTNAVESVNRRRGDSTPHNFPTSRRVAHRSLILAICGDQGPDEVTKWG